MVRVAAAGVGNEMPALVAAVIRITITTFYIVHTVRAYFFRYGLLSPAAAG